ncbi:MAG: non-heme iron oxygenase ferredoxin subunit [Acidimicrobiales bacterium]
METIRVPRHSLRPGHAIRLEGGPYGICLVRIGDAFYALSDRCSHANVSLSEGEVDSHDCLIECWKHGSSFSLEDGEPQSLPATEPVPVYEVTVDGDDVVVTVR